MQHVWRLDLFAAGTGSAAADAEARQASLGAEAKRQSLKERCKSLAAYHEQTQPLLAHYEKSFCVSAIDANRPQPEVWDSIARVLPTRRKA